MRRRLITIASASVVMGMFMAGPSVAADVSASIANGKKIFEQGKGAAAPCNSCHGATGIGDDAMGTPRLANLGYTYIIKQLTDFADDKRTDTTLSVMNGFAKELSVQDRRDVSAYVNTLKVDAPPSDMKQVEQLGTPVGKTHLGKRIVLEGLPEKGVTACKSCHGWNGRGRAPLYPKIGKQRYVYLVNQLKKWRDGSRANDMLSQMQKVAQKMSDEDIYNAAAYLTKAGPTTGGNVRIPNNSGNMEHVSVSP